MPKGVYLKRKALSLQEEIVPSEPRFAQLAIGPWKGDAGINHSVYGLTSDGRVYVFRKGLSAWVPLPTRVLREE